MGNTLNLGSKLTFDVNSGVSAIKQLDSALARYGATVDNIDRLSVRLSRSNEVLALKFREVDASGNRVTTTLRGVNGAYQRTGITVEETTDKIDKSAKGISNLTRVFNVFKGVLAGQIAFRTIAAGINTFETSITNAGEFTEKIAQILTISQGSDLVFANTAREVRKLSDEFGNPILDTAAATYETLSNQVAKGSESFAIVREAARFSQAAVASNADAVSLLTAAINAYGLGAERASQVSAIFFKGIDLGRFQAKDIANNFGRVAATAAAIGVSLEETVAGLATTTINGLKASEAMTGLNSVFSDLLKPTKELKKVFQDIGVESGAEGIATFGLPGFLQKLQEQSKGSDAALAQLFDNVRALRTIFQTTGDNAVKFSDTLEQITNASEKTAKAVDIVAQSAGRRLKVELEKTKNFFIVDFGVPALETILKIGDAFGGLSNVVKTGTTIIVDAAGAYVLYRGSIIGVTFALETLSALQGGKAIATSLGLANAFFATKTAADAAKISIIGLGSVAIAPIAAAAGLGAAAGVGLGVLTADNTNLQRDTIDLLNNIDTEVAKSARFFKDAEVAKENAILKRIKTAEQLELQSLATQRAAIQASLNQQQLLQADLLIDVKKAEDLYFSGLTETINVTRKKVNDAINDIRQAKDLIVKAPGQLERNLEGRRENLPTRTIGEINQELLRVRNRRAALAASVSPNSEVEQVQDVFRAIDESLVREAALRSKLKEIRGIDAKDRPRSALLREENQLEAKRTENLNAQKIALQAVIAQKQKNVSVSQNEVAIQEESLKAQRRALELFLRAKPEESSKAFGEFVKQTVLGQQPKTAEEFARQKELFQQVNLLKDNLRKQADLIDERKDAETTAKRLQKQKELQRNALRELTDESIRNQVVAAGSLQAALAKLTGVEKNLPTTASSSSPNTAAIKNGITATIKATRDAIASGDIEAIKNSLEKVNEAIAQLNKPFTNQSIKKDFLPGVKNARQDLEAALEIMQRVVAIRTQVNLVGLTAGVPAEFQAASSAVSTFGQSFIALESTAITSLNRIKEAIIATRRELNTIKAESPAITPTIQGNAAGGFIKSPDNIIAGFKVGESVLNERATAMFTPQIIAMNAGRTPNFSQSTSNHIDSVNINVSDSGSPNETAREVLKLLNRELRRGSSRVGK